MSGTSQLPVELPRGWACATLADVAEIVLGQSPPSSTYNVEGDGLPFYQGKAEFGELYPVPSKWCSAPHKIAEGGDVLISVRAPVGPTNLSPGRSCIGRGLAAMRGRGGITSRFLLYTLRSSESTIAQLGTGTTFRAITGSQLRSFPICLPPLAEQDRIVAKIEGPFTQLDAGVQALHKVKAQLKRYRQAVLKAAFEGKLTAEWREEHKGELEPASALLERIRAERGEREDLPALDTSGLPRLPENWAWTRVGEVARAKGGKRLPKGHTYSEVPSSHPYIRVTDFENRSVNTQSLRFLRPETQRLIGKYTISKDDVYISIAGSIGKVGLVPEHLDGANLTENAAKITDIVGTEKRLLCYYLDSPFSQKQIQRLTISSNQPKLALFRIEQIVVPLPPTVEQPRLVEGIERRLSFVDEVEKAVEQSLRQSDRLRQSILKRAFEGRLVPQDPSDEPAEQLLERIRQDRAKREPIKSTGKATVGEQGRLF